MKASGVIMNVSQIPVATPENNECVLVRWTVLGHPVAQTSAMLMLGHTFLADGKNGEKLSAGRNVSSCFSTDEYAVWVNGYSHLFEVSDEAARFFVNHVNHVTPGDLVAAHDRLLQEIYDRR